MKGGIKIHCSVAESTQVLHAVVSNEYPSAKKHATTRRKTKEATILNFTYLRLRFFEIRLNELDSFLTLQMSSGSLQIHCCMANSCEGSYALIN